MDESSNIFNDIEKYKCAPNKIYSDGSCFPYESLLIIAKEYNSIFKNTPINLNLSKKDLVIALINSIKECGNNQMCWLNIKWIKQLKNNDINNNTFRPKGPQGQFTWLNTTDIDSVIEQYTNHYNDFYFFGAVPVDFSELRGLPIYNIDFDKLIQNNIFKIGLVINFDNHRQTGSHWVAVFADLKLCKIYYFDSYGKPPRDKRITNFIKKITLWCHQIHTKKEKYIEELDTDTPFMKHNYKNKYERKFDIRYNSTKHQNEGSECGVYSINFILRLLKGETFEQICNNITSDREVNKCRNKYFRNTPLNW